MLGRTFGGVNSRKYEYSFTKKNVCKCFSVEMCCCADRKQNNFAHMNEVNFFLLTDKPNIIHLILICLANKLHLFTLNWNMYRKLKMHLWSAKNFVSWIVYTDLNLKFSWQTVSSLVHYKYSGLIIYLLSLLIYNEQIKVIRLNLE